MKFKLLLIAATLATFCSSTRAQTVINYSDPWKYNVPTTNPQTAWRNVGFDDTVPLNGVPWGSGPGLLGYETAQLPQPILTAIPYSSTQVTYLFRKTFNFTGSLTNAQVSIDQIVDDGVVYYLNGNLIGSKRPPINANWDAVANGGISDATEENNAISGPATGLQIGNNVLCAEVHQIAAGSSDMVFGARVKISNPLPGLYPIRIMPFGDSITSGDGGGNPPGYRKFLYDSLTALGYSIDMVGTETYNDGGWTGDIDHQGENGNRIDEIDGGLEGWQSAIAPPDVVLLLIGTNDFGQNYDVDHAPDRLDLLITHLTQYFPHAHIIVSNVLMRTDNAAIDAAIQSKLNPFIPGIVANHVAEGHHVTFIDQRARLGASDLCPDNLHPNPTGHSKLAEGWVSAITPLIAPNGDTQLPGIARITPIDRTHLKVTFTKTLDESTIVPANFTISGAISISSVSLDSATKREATFTISTLTDGANYTLSATNLKDRKSPQNVTTATSKMFHGFPIRGVQNNVPESSKYTLVYSLDIPTSASYNTTPPAYSVDRHEGLGAFNRIAYYLELQAPGQPLQYCWISVNPFTSDPAKIGIPTPSTGIVLQNSGAQLTNWGLGATIISNVSGISGRNKFVTFEFWPHDYGTTNSNNIPAASDSLYDNGDQRSAFNGYGSMQIHGYFGSPIMSFNHWGNGSGHCDIGLGPNTGGTHPDWTGMANASAFSVRSLQVYVRLVKEDLLSLRISRYGSRLTAIFAGLPNTLYRVQRSTDLFSWATLAEVTSNAYGDLSYVDRTPPASKAYYKLVRP